MTRPWPAVPPPITAGMRVSARDNPNSWLYVFDPAVSPAEDTPQWAIIGAYPVNADGEIEDQRFAANDTYRPSPQALGWLEPRSVLERIIQLAKAGHRPAHELPAAVLDAGLLVHAPDAFTRLGDHRDIGVIGLPDARTGRTVVPACSSAEHVPAHWPSWQRMRGSDLVPLLRGRPLAIDPDSPISAILPAELLVAALRARDVRQRRTPAENFTRARTAAGRHVDAPTRSRTERLRADAPSRRGLGLVEPRDERRVAN